MTDLQLAEANLAGHSICLCKDGILIFSEKRGIGPMMGFIEEGLDLTDYSVADLVVGKAAAMLFVKSKIKEVFAKTLSEDGKSILEKYNISYRYETLTKNIINRMGNDICPMEKTIRDIEDPEEAYFALKIKLQKMIGK